MSTSRQAPRQGRATFLIRERPQLRALASPVRQEILDTLTASGPSTIAQIAAELGRRPHALYFHIRTLQDVGLIQPFGFRRTGKSDAAIFAVPARRMRIHYDLGSPSFRAGMRKTLRSMLRLAERDFVRGLSSKAAVADGPLLNLWSGRVKGRLTAAQLARVNRLMRRLLDQINDHPRQQEGELHAVTLAIVPLPEAGPRRRS